MRSKRRSFDEDKATDPLRIIAGLPPESPRLPAAQSYRADALSDAEKALIDFLVDKAIEAWLKR
jgi:hypothetical protein